MAFVFYYVYKRFFLNFLSRFNVFNVFLFLFERFLHLRFVGVKYEGNIACQMCSGFCVPQLLKLIYFSFFVEKNEKGIGPIGFFCNTA